MTFETIRLILIFVEVATETDISDYKVLFYSIEPLFMGKAFIYKDIPDCFNCNVHGFDIDLDKKIIFIKSKGVKNE